MNNSLERLMTLSEAAEMLFGPGGKVNTLRTEIRKGNLTASKIANTHYVTQSALREMQIKCQEKDNQPASTGTQKTKPGSSETGRFSEEQAAAAASMKALRKRLNNTSPKSGSQNQKAGAQVISIAQQS